MSKYRVTVVEHRVFDQVIEAETADDARERAWELLGDFESTEPEWNHASEADWADLGDIDKWDDKEEAWT